MATNPTPIDHQTAPAHLGAVAPGTPLPPDVKRLQLILVKPSKYDDEGYVMRYVRGVLPSNTMAALAGLTQEVIDRGLLGNIKVETEMLDEIVNKIDPRKLARKYKKRGVQTLVALCGVQTNQFPRAADMALEFQAAGMPVMIGGFHVSGAIALSKNGLPPECQALIDAGITLVKGEVEDVWDQLLIDAVHGRLKTFYDIIERPDITHAHIPVVNPRLMKKFAYPYMGTIDTGRGCPFNCSFCTIINVQGKQMRCRAAEKIKDRILRNAAFKIDYYFFTDDNFSRNPNWEAIFDALIQLRRDDSIDVHFMMQVDTKAYRINNFMPKAAEAGCSQVFIGMETLNPDNIKAIGKNQNTTSDYRNMIDAWHSVDIACHVGYIIGFPYDTVQSVREEVIRLRDEVGVDQASFFMLTPLPGSADHVRLQERGAWMDPDYNRFDSFHPATHHPRMSDDEWFDVYNQAWRDFYSVNGMKSILARATGHTYWGLFKNFLWYKYSAVIEETHPMICGFLRRKDRLQRRPGFAVEGRLRHMHRRVSETAIWARRVVSLYFEMQEVWLATRGRAQFSQNIDDLRRRYDEILGKMGDSKTQAGEALGRRMADVRAGYEKACLRAGAARRQAAEVSRQAAEDLNQRLDQLRKAAHPVRTRWRRLGHRLNPFAIHTATRAHLNDYWRQTWNKLRRGRIFQINPIRLVHNFLSDVKLCARFSISILSGYDR